MGSFNLFHAENSMIETFYAAPRASLAGVPRSYYADIDVYGEYVTTAQSLKVSVVLLNYSCLERRYYCNCQLTYIQKSGWSSLSTYNTRRR